MRKKKLFLLRKKIETEKKKVKENLERQTSALIKKITDSKKAVEEEFNQFVKSKQDILYQQEASIESERKLLNETYSFCSNILRCGSDIEVLSMKTDMKERLSKLQSSNDSELCDIKGIVLPDIQFCSERTIFKMVVKTNETESSKLKSQSNAVVAKEHKEGSDKKDETTIKGFQDQQETKKPNYTSVAWIDEDTIVVVDQRNQKLKIISRGKGVAMTAFFKDCFMVTTFKNGIACRSEGSTMHVFSSSLELRKTISSVSTLLTCHPKSSEICWLSGLKKICILTGNDVKEIAIYDPYTDSNLSNPMFGHVLLDGTFAVSDWDKECIFLIGSSGRIARRKYIYPNTKPGPIFSDSNFKLYVCDSHKSVIVIIAQNGETLRSVYTGNTAPYPKSIAIRNEIALIANGLTFVETELKSVD